jgi:GNAT superfamily N-acetyltransferase
VSSVYEFIEGEKANYPIVKMCRWANVCRAGFYEWRGRPASATAQRRGALAARIVAIFAEHHQTYGYRRIHQQLAREGTEAGPELVRSIMRAEGLVACQPRAYKVTTVADGDAVGPADLVQRDFTADAPGYGFVSEDIPELGIGVVEGRRGEGIGRALMNGIIAAAKGGLSLSVEDDNPAVELYRKSGFVPVGRVGNSTTMLREARRS